MEFYDGTIEMKILGRGTMRDDDDDARHSSRAMGSFG